MTWEAKEENEGEYRYTKIGLINEEIKVISAKGLNYNMGGGGWLQRHTNQITFLK